MATVKRSDEPTRSYRSPRRTAQARATRAAVLGAARDRFLQVGYVATTVDAVAAAAEVSPATVYGTFGSKRGLLEAAIDEAIVGDAEQVPLFEREWVEQLAAVPDPRDRIPPLYRGLADAYERSAQLDGVLEEAAVGDPALAELRAAVRERQRADNERFCALILGDELVFRSVDRTRDREALGVLGGIDVFRRLTRDFGWTSSQWEDWVVELAERLYDTRAGAG
jgi:AcrR family transcriptional regulator